MIACRLRASTFLFFFFNDTATTEIYTLSYTTLFRSRRFAPALIQVRHEPAGQSRRESTCQRRIRAPVRRSEEHTSELQSHSDLVCRLLLEKKKNTTTDSF